MVTDVPVAAASRVPSGENFTGPWCFECVCGMLRSRFPVAASHSSALGSTLVATRAPSGEKSRPGTLSMGKLTAGCRGPGVGPAAVSAQTRTRRESLPASFGAGPRPHASS
jgi:hypothetical protein